MKRTANLLALLPFLVIAFYLGHMTIVQAGNPAAGQDTVLKAADISPKIFPEHVFFRGQVAPTQLRNTGGVHFSDDLYVLAGLVDSSGYSTEIKEKYQGYLLNEVTLDIGGKALKPGAYGFGFVSGKFMVMDLGGNDILEGTAQHDAEMKRPMPLQVTASTNAGTYRLYVGRDFIEFHRAR
ncbi:MAG TPA: hypothetical protein VFI60_08030 [Candidatus Acidoferrum sp.]|nr:hypothetical protein [Candidatus Acidoferrum sp.]